MVPRRRRAPPNQQWVAKQGNSGGPMFLARPGHGYAGRWCVVRTNHFLVRLGNMDLHMYDVKPLFRPTPRGHLAGANAEGRVQGGHVEAGVRAPADRPRQKRGRLPVYDGRKSLFTAGKLPFDTKEYEVTLYADASKERKCTVAIKLARSISQDQLAMLVAGYPTDISAQALQVLGIVLRDVVLNEHKDME
ncbi:protein argonaute 18-like [Phragmites australis]|uniref:protein argonaute 18-like n=1 Tax=Phragmites australis TaxID=29695 RepID=UPI002D79A666|nr:protein argonaute 18-like [Phragmites australis]